jgi:hypothetical protein
LPRDPHGDFDQAIGKNLANGNTGLIASYWLMLMNNLDLRPRAPTCATAICRFF